MIWASPPCRPGLRICENLLPHVAKEVLRPSPGNSIRTWNKYLLIHTMIISYHDYTANNIYFFHSAAVEVQASCCHALRTENRQADVVSQVCYRRPWPWSSLRCKALITPRTNKPGVLMRITHCSCHNWRCSIEIVSMASEHVEGVGAVSKPSLSSVWSKTGGSVVLVPNACCLNKQWNALRASTEMTAQYMRLAAT